jgi:hypothetical protein
MEGRGSQWMMRCCHRVARSRLQEEKGGKKAELGVAIAFDMRLLRLVVLGLLRLIVDLLENRVDIVIARIHPSKKEFRNYRIAQSAYLREGLRLATRSPLFFAFLFFFLPPPAFAFFSSIEAIARNAIAQERRRKGEKYCKEARHLQ